MHSDGSDDDDDDGLRHSMLATLASVSAQRIASAPAGGSSAGPSPRLVFDPVSRLPPADVVDELLQHTNVEVNVVGKIMHPKQLLEDRRCGRACPFLLLALMANNVLYSAHPAIRAVGHVPAIRQFVDQAKAWAPAALESPSVRNGQALLLLALAYLHLGRLDVSSHYSGIALQIVQQLGVCRIDDDSLGDNEWVSASWLEREQARRLVWGSFTLDTYLSLMRHTAPYVLVDLGGVNRPCAQNMWHVGNDNLESLSFPPSGFGAQPGDSEYLVQLKAMKLNGMTWCINGSRLQLNFCVLGNALLRAIGDPQAPQAQVDRLVVNASRSVDDWIRTLPALPPRPNQLELGHTLLISTACLGLRSTIAPYLLSRFHYRSIDQPWAGTEPLNREAADVLRGLNTKAGCNQMLSDYMHCAHRHYRLARMSVDMGYDEAPTMFSAYSMMVCGGIFVATAHAAPTQRLRERHSEMARFFKRQATQCAARSALFQNTVDEIERIEHMVQFLPRRLSEDQLCQMRDILVPRSIEAAVNKQFACFILPALHIVRAANCASASIGSPVQQRPTSPVRQSGAIPLTSNVCAIFGQTLASLGPLKSLSSRLRCPMSRSSSSSSSSRPVEAVAAAAARLGSPETQEKHDSQPPACAQDLPNYRLSYTAIASLFVGLVIATKDGSFFSYMDDDTADAAGDRLPQSSPKKGSSLGNILN
ncbi:hypothetical protein IWQ57_002512 [Coemansia nantahalensis]|uniref:Uncharacterized protein n=1 Tax=Coemansia nantahalensis TaxID=2789366 RepID=A0ACC1JZT1_9FUNG|nr:hypothetical protein IWQ57_002512 [Coemansia nantahalensis]